MEMKRKYVIPVNHSFFGSNYYKAINFIGIYFHRLSDNKLHTVIDLFRDQFTFLRHLEIKY